MRYARIPSFSLACSTSNQDHGIVMCYPTCALYNFHYNDFVCSLERKLPYFVEAINLNNPIFSANKFLESQCFCDRIEKRHGSNTQCWSCGSYHASRPSKCRFDRSYRPTLCCPLPACRFHSYWDHRRIKLTSDRSNMPSRRQPLSKDVQMVSVRSSNRCHRMLQPA